nr:MAG TPA: hypothetical protein [Bacteriophage sp.]
MLFHLIKSCSIFLFSKSITLYIIALYTLLIQ